jgi:hypothetical protein
VNDCIWILFDSIYKYSAGVSQRNPKTVYKFIINKIFNSVSIKEQAYNPSLAVLRLSRKYSDDRLETSCELALTRGVRCPRYHHLQSILASDQDKIFLESKNSARQDDPSMGYLRGSDYYD